MLDAFCCHYTVLTEEGSLSLSLSEKNPTVASPEGHTDSLPDKGRRESPKEDKERDETTDKKINKTLEKRKLREEEEEKGQEREGAEEDQDLAVYDGIEQFYCMDVRLYEEQAFSGRERLWLEKYLRDQDGEGGPLQDDEDFSVVRSYLESHYRDRNLPQSSYLYPSTWRLFLHLVIDRKAEARDDRAGAEWNNPASAHSLEQREPEEDDERKEDARIAMMKKRLRDKLKLIIDKEEQEEKRRNG